MYVMWSCYIQVKFTVATTNDEHTCLKHNPNIDKDYYISKIPEIYIAAALFWWLFTIITTDIYQFKK